MTASLLSLLAFQNNYGGEEPSAAVGIVPVVIGLVIALVVLAAMWKIFEKAGEPGWAAIVPIYNVIVLLKIAGRPAWWFILLFIPVVGFVVAILVSIDIAKRFGKGTGFGIGLAILGFIFYPILGFGDARYNPNAA